MTTHSMKNKLALLAIAYLLILSACSSSPNGDVAHGKELYTQCQACHKPQENYLGPMHCGVIGRKAGSVAGFDYSEAMKASGLVWTTDNLDKFLTSPISFVDGTKMGFAGFPEARDRADVIAYLQQANNDPAVCPRH
jgi:cytochrome c